MMRPRVNATRAGIAGLNCTAPVRPSVSTWACSAARSGPSPTSVAVTMRPAVAQTRDRVEQHVDALDRPQLAHEHQIGRVGCAFDRLEFVPATRRYGRCAPGRAGCRSCGEKCRRYRRFRTGTGRRAASTGVRSPDKIFRPGCRGRTAGCRHAAYRRARRAWIRTRAGHRRRLWRRARAPRRPRLARRGARHGRGRARSPGLAWRCIGTRVRPSASDGSSWRSVSSARVPPVRESAINPTRCPRAICSRVRSSTWRNRPPTGARNTCRMFNGFMRRICPAPLGLPGGLGSRDG